MGLMSGTGRPQMAGSPVRGLLFARCPPAVLFGVPEVVVNAVEGQPVRGIAHVRVEGGEVLSPAFADRDASTTVVAESVVFGVHATADHVSPALVRSRRFADTCLPVPREAVAGGIAEKTPATARVSHLQAAAEDDMFSAAVALAPPIGSAVSLWRSVENQQATETAVCYVDERGHDGRRLRPCRRFGKDKTHQLGG